MVRHFFKYFIDNCQLEYVSEHKHIGIQLSSNLSWSEHNADIVKKNVQTFIHIVKLVLDPNRQRYKNGRHTRS